MFKGIINWFLSDQIKDSNGNIISRFGYDEELVKLAVSKFLLDDYVRKDFISKIKMPENSEILKTLDPALYQSILNKYEEDKLLEFEYFKRNYPNKEMYVEDAIEKYEESIASYSDIDEELDSILYKSLNQWWSKVSVEDKTFYYGKDFIHKQKLFTVRVRLDKVRKVNYSEVPSKVIKNLNDTLSKMDLDVLENSGVKLLNEFFVIRHPKMHDSWTFDGCLLSATYNDKKYCVTNEYALRWLV